MPVCGKPCRDRIPGVVWIENKIDPRCGAKCQAVAKGALLVQILLCEGLSNWTKKEMASHNDSPRSSLLICTDNPELAIECEVIRHDTQMQAKS